MRKVNVTGLLVLLALICFRVPELSAQIKRAEKMERETLRGLKGFYVLVEELRADIVRAGLTKKILQTDVELKLRKAGIRVLLTKDEMQYLYIRVTAMDLKAETQHEPIAQRGFLYLVDATFRQGVILSRNRSIKLPGATTWESSLFGISADLRGIREVVSDLVDEFMNDYLAVNPK